MRSNMGRRVLRRGFLLASGATIGGVAAHAYGQLPAGKDDPAPTAQKLGLGSDDAPKPKMKIADELHPPPGPLWRMVKQCGVDYAVGFWDSKFWDSTGDLGSRRDEPPWSAKGLARFKQTFDEAGFQLAVIESPGRP